MDSSEWRHDPFPSRGAEARIEARPDPVVYTPQGRFDDTVIDADAVNRYEREGFLLLDGFVDEERLKGLLDEMDRLRFDERLREHPGIFHEPGSGAVRSIFDVHRRSEVFAEMVADERLLRLVTRLLGSGVYLHQTRLNYKPAFYGTEFFWHSDFETWHSEDGMPRMRAVSCSLLLHRNDHFNGPLMLIPGSHWHFVACPGETPMHHYRRSLRRQEYGVPEEESLRTLAAEGELRAATGSAGSLLLFDCNIMHGSNSNISPWPRSNLFFVYNSVENRLVEPYCGRPPRPNYVANRAPETLRAGPR